jgi:capsule polysaccharide export protein KpsE/RkpR
VLSGQSVPQVQPEQIQQFLARKDQKAIQAQLELRDLKDQLGHKDQLEIQVQLVQPVQPDLKVQQAQLRSVLMRVITAG